MDDGVERPPSFEEETLQGIWTYLDRLSHRLDHLERRQEALEASLEERKGERAWSLVCPHCRVVLRLPDEAVDEEGHLEWVCPVCQELIHDDQPDYEAYVEDERLEN